MKRTTVEIHGGISHVLALKYQEELSNIQQYGAVMFIQTSRGSNPYVAVPLGEGNCMSHVIKLDYLI
jgi:hypothetical protein